MDVRKLISAAKHLEKTNPVLAKEILKTAQDLGSTDVQPQSPPSTSGQPNVISNNPNTDPNALNKEVKNYGDVQEPQRDTHKITFDVDVTPGFSKVNLVNHLMNALNNHPEIKQNHIEVTGYSFRS